jgi:hypothetical protein
MNDESRDAVKLKVFISFVRTTSLPNVKFGDGIPCMIG